MPSVFQLMNLFSFLAERALFPTWTSIQRLSVNFHGAGSSPEKIPQLALPSLASSGAARIGGHRIVLLNDSSNAHLWMPGPGRIFFLR